MLLMQDYRQGGPGGLQNKEWRREVSSLLQKIRGGGATKGTSKVIEGWKMHCMKRSMFENAKRCADFMKQNGYQLLHGRWKNTKRVDESKDEEYDYVEGDLERMISCEEKDMWITDKGQCIDDWKSGLDWNGIASKAVRRH